MKWFLLLILCLSSGGFLEKCADRLAPEKTANELDPPRAYFSEEMLPLGEAIYQDQAPKVKELLEMHGWSPDTISERGYTLLQYAINRDSKQVFKLLLEMGANPSKISRIDYTYLDTMSYYNLYWPLQNAIYKDDLYYVNTLLDYGVDVNMGAPLQYILQHAPPKHVPELLKRFVEKGSDLNVYDDHEETPLTTALKQENFDCANLLIDLGADLSLLDGHGYTLVGVIQRRRGLNLSNEYKQLSNSTLRKLRLKGDLYPYPLDQKFLKGESRWDKRQREKDERAAAADSVRRHSMKISTATHE